MKVFCVRIGNKYGPQYEDYLNSKLANKYEVTWIKEPFDPRVALQWNKMLPMSLDIDEPVCVMDIDVLLVNEYEQVFDYPVQRGQFLGHPNWWNQNNRKLNGGFFKYYPKDCRYIFDKFIANPQHWMTHYIKTGETIGPVNGEQFFVEDSVNERLELVSLPNAWFARWFTSKLIDGDLTTDASRLEKTIQKQWEITSTYKKATGNNYVYLDGEFHPDIKFVHFNNFINQPHDWEDYSKHVQAT